MLLPQLLQAVAGLDRGKLCTDADMLEIDRLVRKLETAGALGMGQQPPRRVVQSHLVRASSPAHTSHALPAGGVANPLSGTPAPIEGTWELVFSSKEVFRASPFFAAFQNGLVQDKQVRAGAARGGAPAARPPRPCAAWRAWTNAAAASSQHPRWACYCLALLGGVQVAEAIFQFTDALPGAYIGRAIQRIDLTAASLASEVDMEVFPGACLQARWAARWGAATALPPLSSHPLCAGFKGTVVTTSRCFVESPAAPATLRLVVDNTRVANSIFPLVDSIAVPVEQLVEQVGRAGSCCARPAVRGCGRAALPAAQAQAINAASPMSQVRGAGATAVMYELTYVSADLRITRCGDHMMVHRRLGSSDY
jgi:hypothetical protein